MIAALCISVALNVGLLGLPVHILPLNYDFDDDDADPDGDVGSIPLRFALVAASAVIAFVAAWQLAVFQFPETMHQARLVMLLIATGGPGD